VNQIPNEISWNVYFYQSINKLLDDKCLALEGFWKSTGGSQRQQGGFCETLLRNACFV